MLNRDIQNNIIKRNKKIKSVDPKALNVLLTGLKSMIEKNIEIVEDMDKKDKVGISEDVNTLIDFSVDLFESSILICTLCGMDAETVMKIILSVRDGVSSINPKDMINNALRMFVGNEDVVSYGKAS